MLCNFLPRYCIGSRQDAADDLAVGLHEALPSDARAASRHRSKVNAGKLDDGNSTLGSINAGRLPHWRPSSEGNLPRC